MTWNKDKYRYFSERNPKATPIREAMNKMFNEYRLTKRFSEMKLVGSWEKIMGKPIAARTSKLSIKEKTLFVKLSSAPLKKELSMSKNRILELLEREGGKGIIKDIHFL